MKWKIMEIFVLSVLIFSVLGASVTHAAGIDIKGDLPIVGTAINVWLYSAQQSGNPCGGVADSGTSLLASDYISSPGGNTDYNGDDDYEIADGAPTSGYMYFCDGTSNTNLRAYYSKSFGEHESIDLGRVDGNNQIDSSLNGNNVVICKSLGGDKLSTQQVQVTAQTYAQYYVKDLGHNINTDGKVYILFNPSDSCAFDTSTIAGRWIDVNSGESFNNYGVSAQFHPDRQVSGKLHSDLSGARIDFLAQDADQSLGLAKVGTITNCNSNGYSTWIDSDVMSGEFRMKIYSDDAGTNLIETVENIPHDFTSQDLNLKITGTVPSDITKIEAEDNNGVKYIVTPSSGSYSLYTPDSTSISSLTIKFYEGSNVVFERQISTVPTQTDGCGQTITINLAKYYGTAHDDLKSGYEIKVYSDSSFTTRISDSLHPGNPDNSNGNYEVYFEVQTGGTQTYLWIIEQSSHNYDSFIYGKTVNPGDKIQFNLDGKIYGKVPTDVSKIATDNDQDGTEWNKFGDVYTNTFVTSSPGKEYRIYTDKSIFGGFSLRVYDSSNLVLERKNKDLSSDDIEFDVSKLYGEIHSSFISSSTAGIIEVYDDKGDTNVLDDGHDVESDGGTNNDDYVVYFESTSLSDGKVDIKFSPDTASYGTTWAMDIGTNDGWKGDKKQLDMIRTFHGSVQNDIKDVALSCDGNDMIIVEVASGSPSTYRGYAYDTLCSHNLYYNADTSSERVLERDAGYTGVALLTQNHGIFNVGKVYGEAHSDLESGDDEINVCSDFDCTSYLSSKDVYPSDNGGDDYEQYFEADSSAPTATNYYIEVDMNDGGHSFITHGNSFQLPSDYSKKIDLIVEKKGVVNYEIAKVGVDRDEDGTDEEVTQTVSTSNGKEYKLFTQTDSSVDVYYYDSSSTELLKIDEDFGTAGTYTNDISKVEGDIPSDIDSVELEKSGYSDGACGGTYYTQTSPVSSHYTLYYQDTGSTSYDILFCKSGTLVLKWSFVDSTGGNIVTINVAKIYGNIESSFYDGTNGEIDVYKQKGSTKLNSAYELTNGAPDTYEVYFVEKDSTQNIDADSIDIYFQDAVGLESWRFGLDNGGSINGGDEINVNFMHKVSGTVPVSLNHINLEDKTGLYDTASNVLFEAEVDAVGGGDCHFFSIYVDSANAQNKWYLDAYDDNGVFVFGKEQGTDSANVQSELDIAKLIGNIEKSFVDSDVSSHVGDSPSIDVFTNWNDNSPLNSHSFIKDEGSNDDSYVVYVESTSGTGDVHIRFIDKNGYASWNFETFSISSASCSVGPYDATILVHGDTPLTINDMLFVVDSSNPSSYLAVGIPKGANEGDDGTYRMYAHDWSASSGNSIDFIVKLNGDSGTKVLQRKSDTPSQLTSQEFDVIKLYGTIEKSYYDNSHSAPVEVYKSYSTVSGAGVDKMSSYNEDDSIVADGSNYDSYIVYFEYEGDDKVDVSFTPSETTAGTTNYKSWRLDIDETPSDDTNTNPLQAGDIVQMNLDRYIKGYVSSSVDYVEIFPNNGGHSVMLASIYTSIDSTSYKIYFDDVDETSNSKWWISVFAKYDGTNQANVLVRYEGNDGDNSYAAIPNGKEFDVGRVIGLRHSNLDKNDDEMYVYTSDNNNVPHEVGSLRSDDQYSKWFQDSNNYYIYFEQLSTSNEKYILKINDVENTAPGAHYLSYDRVWDDNDGKVGDTINQDLDALKEGTVREECNGNRMQGILTTQRDFMSSTILATTETYYDGHYDFDGTYRFYTAPGTYDIYYEKTGFVDYIMNNEALTAGDNVNNVVMQYVAKVYLEQENPIAPRPLPGADVYIINTDNEHEQLQTCSNGGYYYFAVDPSMWQSADFRAEKEFYTTVFDDNGGRHFPISENTQAFSTMWLDTDKNAVSLRFEKLYDDDYIHGNTDVTVLENTKFNSTLYYNDFEDRNDDGWTSTGLWHPTVKKAHSGDYSWWYGQESTGDYDTGSQNSGSLISPQIDLTGQKEAQLSFWSWEKTEISDTNDITKDIREVDITIDDGAIWHKLWSTEDENVADIINEEGHWYERILDISQYTGNRVRVKFVFDSADSLVNGYEGWYIDDVKITTDKGVFDNVSLYYAPYNSPTMKDDWTLIGTDNDGSNGWNFNVDTTQIPDGDYYLMAVGEENHYGIVSDEKVGPIHIDNTAPILDDAEFTNSVANHVYRNGHTVRIYLDMHGEEGLDISAYFGNVDTNFIRGRENVYDAGSGEYEISYTISENNKKSDGQYPISFEACDKSGNCIVPTQTLSLVLDNTPPVTIATTNVVPNTYGWYNSDVVVTLSASDANGVEKTYYKLDDGNWMEYMSPITISNEGEHMLYYYSVDIVENRENVKTKKIYIDKTAPEKVDVILPSFENHNTNSYYYYKPGDKIKVVWQTPYDKLSGVKDYTIKISYGSSDYRTIPGISGNTYILNAVDFDEFPGPYVLSVISTDYADNEANQIGKTFNFVIDKTNPHVTVLTPLNVNSKTFTVTATATDSNGVKKCKMDLNNVDFDDMAYTMTRTSNNQFARTITVPSDDTYNVYVKCEDLAGNIGSSSGSFVVSAEAPSVVSSSPGQGYKTSSSAAKVTVVTDMTATCKWDLKDVDYDHMANTMDGTGTTHTIEANVFDNFDDGLYQIYYRCKGTNGKIMSSSGLIQYIIDRETPSSPSPVYPKNGGFVGDSDIVFQWTAAEDSTSGIDHYVLQYDMEGTFTSPFEVTIDKTSKEISHLTDGTYYWRVKAVDRAGNEGDWSEVMEFTVDTTDPAVSSCTLSKGLISYYPLNNANPTATVQCNLYDANLDSAKVYVKTSGGTVIAEFDMDSSGAATIDAKKIGVDGEYTVYVEAKDKTSHASTISVDTIKVDGTAPETIVALDDTSVSTQPGGQTTTTIRAVLRDITSNIKAAEFYVGPGDARADISQRCSPTTSMYATDGSFVNDGNRYELNPVDGSFDSGFEEAVATVNGDFSNKCIFVHAEDSAGNWEQTKAIYITQNGKIIDLGTRSLAASPESTGVVPATGLTIGGGRLAAIVVVSIIGLAGIAMIFWKKFSKNFKFSFFKLFK